MKRSSYNTLYVLFCDQVFDKGGAPEDYRRLILEIDNQKNCDALTFTTDKHKKKISNSHINNVVFNWNDLNKILSQYDKKVALIVGYSSLKSIYYLNKIRCRFNTKILFPVNQINPFLDEDNPFDTNTVPSIENIENGFVNFSNTKSRVREGKKGLKSLLMKIKRKVYRATLGKYLVTKVDHIAVFSDFERSNIKKYYPKIANKCFTYYLGADKYEAIDKRDKFSEHTINITIWSRIDPYYKGIDLLVYYVSSIKNSIPDNVNFNLIGPNYRNGYAKVESLIKKKNVEDKVFLYKTGDYTQGSNSFFTESDFILSLSRWDGFPRTLREAVVHGVPIIANSESNFDSFCNEYNAGIVLSNQVDFEKFIKNVKNKQFISDEKKKADKLKLSLSWVNITKKFIDRVEGLS